MVVVGGIVVDTTTLVVGARLVVGSASGSAVLAGAP